MKNINIIVILFLHFSIQTLSAKTYTVNIHVDVSGPEGIAIKTEMSNEFGDIIIALNELCNLLKVVHEFRAGSVNSTSFTGYGEDHIKYQSLVNTYFNAIDSNYKTIEVFIHPHQKKAEYNATENYISIYSSNKTLTPIYLHEIAHKIVYDHSTQPMGHIGIDNDYLGCILEHENYCRNLMSAYIYPLWAGVPFTLLEQSKSINKRKQQTGCSNSHFHPAHLVDSWDESTDNCDHFDLYQKSIESIQKFYYKDFKDEELITNINVTRKILRENGIIPYQSTELKSDKTLEILKQNFKGKIPVQFIGNEDYYLRSLIYGASVFEKRAYVESNEFNQLLRQEAYWLTRKSKKINQIEYYDRRRRDINRDIERDYQEFLKYNKGR